MVPRAEFRSYYGRPVLKPPVWEDDIAYYFFLGGLSAGCSLLGAGADLTGRPALRRGTPDRRARRARARQLLPDPRPGPARALPPHAAGGQADLADERRHLDPRRVRAGDRARRGRRAAAAAAARRRRSAGWSARWPARRTWPRPRSRPAVASYTAVLLSQTAVPAWHEAHEELPFIFTGSAAASAGGLGMIVAPVRGGGPGAPAGAATARSSSSPRRAGWSTGSGCVGEAFDTGEARRDLRCGAAGSPRRACSAPLLLGRRSRLAAAGCRRRAAGRRLLRAARHAATPASSPPRTRSTSSSRSAAGSRSRARPVRVSPWVGNG